MIDVTSPRFHPKESKAFEKNARKCIQKCFEMHVTAINFAKKAKTRFIMIMMESLSSGHRKIDFRDKQSEKKEILAFDPYVQMMAVYRELKKVRTMRGKFELREDYNIPKFNEEGEIIKQDNRKRKIPTLDSEKPLSNVI